MPIDPFTPEGAKRIAQIAGQEPAPMSASVLSAQSVPTLPQPDYTPPPAAPAIPFGVNGNLYGSGEYYSTDQATGKTNIVSPNGPQKSTVPTFDDIFNTPESDIERAFKDTTINSAKTAGELAGETAFRTEQEGLVDLTGKKKTVNDLTTSLNNLKTEADQIPLQIQQDFAGRGATAGGVAPIQTGLLRNNAIRQLGVSAMLNAANGNLATAQDQVDAAVKAKFDPLRAQLAAQQAQLTALTPLFNAEEKKRADKQAALLQERSRLLDQQEQEQKDINGVMLIAAQYGADAQTLSRIQSATSYQDAIYLAGPALRDPKAQYELEGLKLDNQLRAAQIETEKAQAANIRAQTVPTAGAPIPSVSDAGQSASGLKASILDGITGLKLSESQSNAVSYAFRMIEANSNINNLIGNGTDESGSYNPTTLLSSVGRGIRSDNARTLDRDLENFIRAQLRKESGAQISDTEMDGGKKIYSPQGILTNDKDIAATKATREQAIQSMIAQAGPAGTYLKQYFDYMQSGGLTPDERAIIYGGTASTPALISGVRYF